MPPSTHKAFAAALQSTPNWFVCGIERESLRTDKAGNIEKDFHPRELGAKLTHPQITTDFGEAQIELITRPHRSTSEALAELGQLHAWIWNQLSTRDQIFWPYSMPCGLPQKDQDIAIAYYGASNAAELKHVYRKGLTHRYGHAMQTISGTHLNLSISDELLDRLARQPGCTNNQRWRDQLYFSLMRNYRRYSFAINYLLGASPVIDNTLALLSRTIRLDEFTPIGIEGSYGHRALAGDHATTLRQSDIGYVSAQQREMNLCFNNLESYISGIESRIHTSLPEFSAIGIQDNQGNYRQLGDGLLQIENEYYTTVRPKRTSQKGQRPLAALAAQGVEYLEIRNIDINPFAPCGIDQPTLDFMVLTFLWCAAQPSPEFGDQDCANIQHNELASASRGRKNGLTIITDQGEHSLNAAVAIFLEQLVPFAELLDQADTRSTQYSQSLQDIASRRLLSDRVVDLCAATHYRDWCIQLALQHQQQLPSLSKESHALYTAQADQSWRDFEQLEAEHKASNRAFGTFLALYMDGITQH